MSQRRTSRLVRQRSGHQPGDALARDQQQRVVSPRRRERSGLLVRSQLRGPRLRLHGVHRARLDHVRDPVHPSGQDEHLDGRVLDNLLTGNRGGALSRSKPQGKRFRGAQPNRDTLRQILPPTTTDPHPSRSLTSLEPEPIWLWSSSSRWPSRGSSRTRTP